MSTPKLYSTGSKTITFVGTGPTGATIGGGIVKEPVHIKPESTATDDIKGKVLLQGNVVKSVVSHEVNNTKSIMFKGKIATSTSTPNIVDNPSKQPSGGALADITIAQDVKMCVVSVKMTTDGICFEDDDN